YHLFAQFLSCAECPSHILADQRPQPTSAHHTMWSSQMSQSEEFRKGIEHLIDQMIARLPEEMQSAARKQLADRREVAWMSRGEAIEAQEEQKRREAEAKLVADSAEQELMRLLVSSLSRYLGQTEPENVKNDVELILKLNEKYTEFEVAKPKCQKNTPADAIDIDHLTGLSTRDI